MRGNKDVSGHVDWIKDRGICTILAINQRIFGYNPGGYRRLEYWVVCESN